MAFVIDAVEDLFDFVGDLFDGAVDLVEGVIDVVLDAGEWVVDTIVKPVIDGVGDIVDYALDNPIEAIAMLATTVLAGPTAALLGTTTTAVTAAATWAIPLASGANTLAKGGDIGDAIKAATLSYAGTTAGKFAGQYAQTAVSQATGSNVAAQVIGAGSKRAATAVVYGQDPVEAFKNGGLQQAVGATMGAVSDRINTIARDTFNVAENELTGFEGLDEGVQNSIFAALGAELGGEDLTGSALMTAADPAGALYSIVDKYAHIGTTVNDWLKSDTFGNLNDAQIGILTDAVSNSFTTALYNNPELSGEAFFGTFREQAFDDVKEIINKPVFKAIDQLSGAYDDTQASATSLQEAETTIAGHAEEYNKYKDLINNGVAEQDALYSTYQEALNRYNSNKNEANANAVNNAAVALESFANNFKSNYENTYLPNLNKAEANYNEWTSILNDRQETYQDNLGYVLSEVDNLGDSFKPLYNEMDRQALLTLKPDFDEDYYREKYGLSEDEDVVQDFFSRENYTEIPVSEKDDLLEYQDQFEEIGTDVAPEVDTTAPQIPVLDEEAIEERPTEELPEGIEEERPEIEAPPVIEAPVDAIDEPPVIDTAEEVLKDIVGEETVEQPDFYEGYFKEGEALREEDILLQHQATLEQIGTENPTIGGYISDITKNIGATALEEIIGGRVSGFAEILDFSANVLGKYKISPLSGTPIDVFNPPTEEEIAAYQDSTLAQDMVAPFVNLTEDTANSLKDSMTSYGKKALEESTATGDIVWGNVGNNPATDRPFYLPVSVENVSLGKNPTFYGTSLHVSGGFVDLVADALPILLGGKTGTLLTTGMNFFESSGNLAREIENKLAWEIEHNPEYRNSEEYQQALESVGGDPDLAFIKLSQEAKGLYMLGGAGFETVGEVLLAHAVVNPMSKVGKDILGSVTTRAGGMGTEFVSEIGSSTIKNFGLQDAGVEIATGKGTLGDGIMALYVSGGIAATTNFNILMTKDKLTEEDKRELFEAAPAIDMDTDDPSYDPTLDPYAETRFTNKDIDKVEIGNVLSFTPDVSTDFSEVYTPANIDEAPTETGVPIIDQPAVEPETVIDQPLDETLGDNVIDFVSPEDSITPDIDEETSNIYADLLGTDPDSLTGNDIDQVDNIINLIEEDITTEAPVDTVIDPALDIETDTAVDTALDTAVNVNVTAPEPDILGGLAQILRNNQQPGYMLGTAKTEEGGDLDYIYDFGSIFPTQEEEKAFTNPYEQYTTSTYDPLTSGLGVLSLDEYLASLKQDAEKDSKDRDKDADEDEDKELLQVFGGI